MEWMDAMKGNTALGGGGEWYQMFSVVFWNTGVLHFIVTQVIVFLRYCFSHIEGLGQPCIKQDYWRHFSNRIYSLHASVSRFGNSCNISNFFIFITFVMGICDQ